MKLTQYLHGHSWSTVRLLGEDLFIYGFAGAIVWYESRGIGLDKELHDLANANLLLLILASLASFLIWFLGENYLFARLFTIFHKKTGYFELLPATAAAYFLQSINMLVANGAMVLFLHQRKGVPWLQSGFTMTFFGFIDGILFSGLITIAGMLNPDSPVRQFAPYSGIAFVVFLLIALWWLCRTPATILEKWLYSRPSLTAFREATLAVYGELLFIRFWIIVPQGVLLWVCLSAFHLNIPMRQVVVLSPAVLAASGSPISPAGLGPLQAIAVHTFSAFAPASKVMASMLAFSFLHLVYRLPLGFGAARPFVRRVLSAGERLAERYSEQTSARSRVQA